MNIRRTLCLVAATAALGLGAAACSGDDTPTTPTIPAEALPGSDALTCSSAVSAEGQATVGLTTTLMTLSDGSATPEAAAAAASTIEADLRAMAADLAPIASRASNADLKAAIETLASDASTAADTVAGANADYDAISAAMSSLEPAQRKLGDTCEQLLVPPSAG